MDSPKRRTPIAELPYSAGLMAQSSWFIEFKKLIQLIASGRTQTEIEWECLQNNLFGMSNEYRTKRVYRYLKNRADMLDEQLFELFIHGDIDMQKQINLIAILRGDRLFFEFLFDVYREKILLGLEELGDMEFNAFFRQKGIESEIVDGWSDSTKKHLRSNYTTCMADAGLLRMNGKRRLLQKPLVDTNLERYMKEVGEEPVIKAIMGVL